ncbi:hypothetical protein [uncultured Thiodictyon sp.]|uniref:REP-associated tyrosine transposase n=1 Tax=uncultured Thiodictyon sp. TaxID=1846217 RepID=UPI0034513267
MQFAGCLLFNVRRLFHGPGALARPWSVMPHPHTNPPSGGDFYPDVWGFFTVNLADRSSSLLADFSRTIPKTEEIGKSRQSKGERGIWQRRFWEHVIRGEVDLQRHVDYTHYNPVKHCYVQHAVDWPFSSFQR